MAEYLLQPERSAKEQLERDIKKALSDVARFPAIYKFGQELAKQEEDRKTKSSGLQMAPVKENKTAATDQVDVVLDSLPNIENIAGDSKRTDRVGGQLTKIPYSFFFFFLFPFFSSSANLSDLLLRCFVFWLSFQTATIYNREAQTCSRRVCFYLVLSCVSLISYSRDILFAG
jgi:hypothetical protein